MHEGGKRRFNWEACGDNDIHTPNQGLIYGLLGCDNEFRMRCCVMSQ